jgi:ketosteroid isomerase-like protein
MPDPEGTDHRAITELFFAYARHFDQNDPESVAALFTDDAVIDYGPELRPIRGRANIAPRISAGLTEIFAATSHHLSNVNITLGDHDDATGMAYVYAWHRYRDGSPDGYLWGQYHNRFRRTSIGWQISELILRVAGTKDFHRSTMHPIGRRE